MFEFTKDTFGQSKATVGLVKDGNTQNNASGPEIARLGAQIWITLLQVLVVEVLTGLIVVPSTFCVISIADSVRKPDRP